jgi:Zn-dependent peptidase ImmA (M78 family)
MSNRASSVQHKVPYLNAEKIQREAQFLLEEFELKFDRKINSAVPVETIAEIQLQLTLEIKDMKSLFPFADVHGAIWLEEGIIGIDQSLDPDVNPSMLGRYNFTLAHEIGHWRLHRHYFLGNAKQMNLFDDGSRIPDVVCRSTERKKPIEWQADAFAANLLMPRSLVFQAWNEFRDGDDREVAMVDLRPKYEQRTLYHRGDVAINTAERDLAIKENFAAPLAERFQVSREAMRIRLEELKLFVEVLPQRLF